MAGTATGADLPHVDPAAVLPAWPWPVAAALDAAAFVLGAFAATVLAIDQTWPRLLVLAYLLFFLGWALLRAAGAPATAVTAVGAVAVGVAATIVASTVAVTLLSWAWRPTAAVLVAVGLAGSTVQRWRMLRSDVA